MREWYIGEVLSSFRRLVELLPELSEEEIFAALELEASARRRKNFIERLIGRAVRLKAKQYRNQLERKYRHGA